MPVAFALERNTLNQESLRTRPSEDSDQGDFAQCAASPDLRGAASYAVLPMTDTTRRISFDRKSVLSSTLAGANRLRRPYQFLFTFAVPLARILHHYSSSLGCKVATSGSYSASLPARPQRQPCGELEIPRENSGPRPMPHGLLPAAAIHDILLAAS